MMVELAIVSEYMEYLNSHAGISPRTSGSVNTISAVRRLVFHSRIDQGSCREKKKAH
jgi:hypothetical protein